MKKIIMLLLVLMIVLTSCGTNNEKKEDSADNSKEIIIGGLAPLTGPVSSYGIAASNGAKMAFEEINSNGGVLGKKIKFLLEDEKGDATEAVNAYNKLIEEGAIAILGDITSKPTLAIAEIAKEDGTPVISPTATMLNITEGRESVFRVCFTDPYQAEILAKYAKENLKAKSVALLTNNSQDYSKGISEAFKKKSKELGMTVLIDEGYAEGDIDFKAQLTNIASKNADVLLIPDYYQSVALIASQAKEVGLKSILLGGDGWDGVIEQLDKSALNVVEGAIFANHYSYNDPNEKIKNFVEGFKKNFNSNPASFAALGYDGAYIIKEAIEKAGSTDKKEIVKALKEIEFDGVTGKLKFDSNNNPVKTVTITKIENGDYKLETVIGLD